MSVTFESPTIHVFCPDLTLRSAGLRLLYRHVEVLAGNGFHARVLHQQDGFRVPDTPDVPIGSLEDAHSITEGDVVVMPEGCTSVASVLRQRRVRLIVVALSWRYIFPSMPQVINWRFLGVERVITNSEIIKGFVDWSMRLPTHVFNWGIRSDLYYRARAKARMVMYIGRKEESAAMFQRVLSSRNPRLTTQLEWRSVDNLAESEYANVVRDAAVFLNLSTGEGLPCSMLEAMRTGALVAGYSGVGGRQILIGSGEAQNCVLAENGDYFGLAQALEPVLLDFAADRSSEWNWIIENGFRTSAPFTREAEEASIVHLWRSIL